MDYDSMEAGRELDACVAERVMGFKWRCDKTTPTWIERYGPSIRVLMPPDDHRFGQTGDDDPSAPLVPEHWDQLVHGYSTNIAAAWLVIDKLVADGWSILIANEPEGWSIEASRVISDTRGSIIGDELAPTFPLATCRVACYVTDRAAALQPAR